MKNTLLQVCINYYCLVAVLTKTDGMLKSSLNFGTDELPFLQSENINRIPYLQANNDVLSNLYSNKVILPEIQTTKNNRKGDNIFFPTETDLNGLIKSSNQNQQNYKSHLDLGFGEQRKENFRISAPNEKGNEINSNCYLEHIACPDSNEIPSKETTFKNIVIPRKVHRNDKISFANKDASNFQYRLENVPNVIPKEYNEVFDLKISPELIEPIDFFSITKTKIPNKRLTHGIDFLTNENEMHLEKYKFKDDSIQNFPKFISENYIKEPENNTKAPSTFGKIFPRAFKATPEIIHSVDFPLVTKQEIPYMISIHPTADFDFIKAEVNLEKSKNKNGYIQDQPNLMIQTYAVDLANDTKVPFSFGKVFPRASKTKSNLVETLDFPSSTEPEMTYEQLTHSTADFIKNENGMDFENLKHRNEIIPNDQNILPQNYDVDLENNKKIPFSFGKVFPRAVKSDFRESSIISNLASFPQNQQINLNHGLKIENLNDENRINIQPSLKDSNFHDDFRDSRFLSKEYVDFGKSLKSNSDDISSRKARKYFSDNVFSSKVKDHLLNDLQKLSITFNEQKRIERTPLMIDLKSEQKNNFYQNKEVNTCSHKTAHSKSISPNYSNDFKFDPYRKTIQNYKNQQPSYLRNICSNNPKSKNTYYVSNEPYLYSLQPINHFEKLFNDNIIGKQSQLPPVTLSSDIFSQSLTNNLLSAQNNVPPKLPVINTLNTAQNQNVCFPKYEENIPISDIVLYINKLGKVVARNVLSYLFYSNPNLNLPSELIDENNLRQKISSLGINDDNNLNLSEFQNLLSTAYFSNSDFKQISSQCSSSSTPPFFNTEPKEINQQSSCFNGAYNYLPYNENICCFTPLEIPVCLSLLPHNTETGQDSSHSLTEKTKTPPKVNNPSARSSILSTTNQPPYIEVVETKRRELLRFLEFVVLVEALSDEYPFDWGVLETLIALLWAY